MHCKVTQKHIDDAFKEFMEAESKREKNCILKFDFSKRCPISRAMDEVDPKHKHHVEHEDYRYAEDPETMIRGRLPRKCRDFMVAFDDGFKVRPFSFKTKEV